MPITFPSVHTTPVSSRPAPSGSVSAKQSFLSRIWGKDGFSFGDILDVINPLQHVPIVSTLYRALTGDAIAPAPRVLGDALFGGPIGAATGVANAVLKYLSGKDMGEQVLAMLPLPTQVEGETVMLAFNNSPTPSTAAPPAVQRKLNPAASKSVQLVRALDYARSAAAFDAYARNSRLLATPQIQNRFGVRF